MMFAEFEISAPSLKDIVTSRWQKAKIGKKTKFRQPINQENAVPEMLWQKARLFFTVFRPCMYYNEEGAFSRNSLQLVSNEDVHGME